MQHTHPNPSKTPRDSFFFITLRHQIGLNDTIEEEKDKGAQGQGRREGKTISTSQFMLSLRDYLLILMTCTDPMVCYYMHKQQDRKQSKKQKKDKARNMEEQEEDIETILANFKKEVTPTSFFYPSFDWVLQVVVEKGGRKT